MHLGENSRWQPALRPAQSGRRAERCLFVIRDILQHISIFTDTPESNLQSYQGTMASPCLPRLFARSARSLCKPRRQLVPRSTWRAASSKHPQGFTPPTDEDLLELRERVQEFTSERPSKCMQLAVLTVCRTRDLRRSRCEDRCGKQLSGGDVAEDGRGRLPRCHSG